MSNEEWLVQRREWEVMVYGKPWTWQKVSKLTVRNYRGCGDMAEFVDIVFDGPPGHESGRFVEIETSSGRSIKFGEWVKRDDGYWVIRIRPTDFAAELTPDG